MARIFTLAALVAALSACGGGGGGSDGGGTAAPGTAAATDPLPTGSTVSAQPAPILTTPQRVNSNSAGQQVLRDVAALQGGGFAVAWLSQDGSSSVQAQRFDAAGARVGAELRMALDPAQTAVAVAVLPAGGYAVATVLTAPASTDQPWITRTSVTVQRYDAAGAPAGTAQELAAVLQDRTAAGPLRYVSQPQVRAWDDGGFVVAWATITEDSTGKVPQFAAQRFDAAGQAAGAVRDLGAGASDTTLQLATAPAGGWYTGTASRVMGRTFIAYAGQDGAAAPQLPAGALGVAEGSLLLPLRDGGTAVLAPTQVYGTLQLYDAAGQARGSAAGLRTMPVSAVALREGGFVLLEAVTAGADVIGQRYDATGAATGSSFSVATAGVAPQLASLGGGAVEAAWTSSTGGDQDVMAQRVQP